MRSILFEDGNTPLIEIKAQAFLEPEFIAELRAKFDIRELKNISPVLPVLSRKDAARAVHHLRGDAAL